MVIIFIIIMIMMIN